ncbi:IS1381%2C transposase OrfA [Streptococcus pneumoniae]|nr:IS1381%2C transposase OrfA [Streptococcus pneumoniae]
MNYEASKQLTDARFKRLVGVQRTTFEEILAVLKTAYQLKHAKGGRKPKLTSYGHSSICARISNL